VPKFSPVNSGEQQRERGHLPQGQTQSRLESPNASGPAHPASRLTICPSGELTRSVEDIQQLSDMGVVLIGELSGAEPAQEVSADTDPVAGQAYVPAQCRRDQLPVGVRVARVLGRLEFWLT
jgi:hypothetical protein